jgi:hypothetical protein
MSDPIKAAQADAKAAEVETSTEETPEKKEPRYGYITFDGVQYGIERRPPSLLISELARVDAAEAESIGVFAEFFETVLGDNYKAFRKQMMRSEAGQDEEVLQALLADVLEKTLGRPTE